MTLGELLKDKELPVKVFFVGCAEKYYTVTHKNKNDCLTTSESGRDDSWSLTSEDWYLYEEPKKTIELEEYLTESINYKCFFVRYFQSDDDFKKAFPRDPIIKTGRKITVEVCE